MEYNLYRCNKCQAVVIAEELESHKHGEIKDLKVVGDYIWIDDGIQYLLAISPEVKRFQKYPDKDTEPSIENIKRKLVTITMEKLLWQCPIQYISRRNALK